MNRNSGDTIAIIKGSVHDIKGFYKNDILQYRKIKARKRLNVSQRTLPCRDQKPCSAELITAIELCAKVFDMGTLAEECRSLGQ